MKVRGQLHYRLVRVGTFAVLWLATVVLLRVATPDLSAGPLSHWRGWRSSSGDSSNCIPGPLFTDEPGGTWYWLRSPEEEKRVVIGLYNRYCIRCHGVDGRGVWDIPCVPDFTNVRWQATRSDGQLARSILEGRGAVMPPFRGTLSLEEAWAMARYLRTFQPGTEMPRPDLGPGGGSAPQTRAP